MNRTVILVILDGLNYRTARDCSGFLQGLAGAGDATLYQIQCELPSLSRPLYECILTGVRPVDSGVVHNQVVRLSHHNSIFSLARKAGKTTAAAAYHWVSELYNRAPFDAIRDRFTHDESLAIQHGCFYQTDSYPDDHLFLDAEYLRRQFRPDFLLIHPMNTDDAGHHHGVDSPQYRNSARRADGLLSAYLPAWREAGYQVLITADHGMNNDHSHGGILPEERDVPLFVIGEAFSHQPDLPVKQTELCGTVCQLLGLTDHHKPYPAGLLRDAVSGA